MSELISESIDRIIVKAQSPDCMARAEKIASELTLPLQTDELQDMSGFDFVLIVRPDRIELLDISRPKKIGAVYVDFVSGAVGHRHEFGRRRREPIGLACGVYKNDYHIVDATAGMGCDAFWLATNGCTVTGFERSPLIAALLTDGLSRAYDHVLTAEKLGGRLSFHCADAREAMLNMADDERPDVVYIDVMYPEKRRRSALPSKEMQVLRSLVGDNLDAVDLFAVAREVARSRVVVKRFMKAAFIDEAFGKPSHIYSGTKTRFDVYFKVDKKKL